jgi:hypothetical protein
MDWKVVCSTGSLVKILSASNCESSVHERGSMRIRHRGSMPYQAALEEGNFSCPTSGITMSKQLAQYPSA